MRKSNELDKLGSALAAAQGEIEGARKDSSNPFFRSKYANLESVVEASRPALVRHGLAVVQTLGSDPNFGPTLVTTLLHSSGQWIEGEQPLMAQSKKAGEPVNAQDLGSAITYARRYGMAAIIGVIQVDDDAEGAVGRGGPGASPVGKPHGNGSSQSAAVAHHTQATTNAVRERLANGQERVPSQPQGNAGAPNRGGPGQGMGGSQVQGRAAEGAGGASQGAIDRFFDDALGVDPGAQDQLHAGRDGAGVPQGRGREVGGGAPLLERAPEAVGQKGAQRTVGGGKANPAALPAARAKNTVPGAVREPGKALPGARADRHGAAADAEGHPAGAGEPDATGGLPGHAGAPAAKRVGEAGGHVGDRDQELRPGKPAGILPGAGEAGARDDGEQGQGSRNAVLVPQTKDEQDWFFRHMGELLKECEAHKGAGLQKIWATNAACINALPGAMKEALVAQKDAIKKKFL